MTEATADAENDTDRLKEALWHAVAMKRPGAALVAQYGRARLAGIDVDPSRLQPMQPIDREVLADVLPVLERLGIIEEQGDVG